MMIIPIDSVEKDTLIAIVEAFVLREGTEYGENDWSLSDKIEQVLWQLDSGKAFLVYSELHETVNIIPAESIKAYEEDDFNT
jgi:hypothetical protein